MSIIIPTYNQSELLPFTVRSATGRGDDIEVIIVDDGSTDDTARIAESLSVAHPDVRYVFQENQGSASARNTGISISQGDYLLFLNTGDELTNSAVPAILMAILEYPECEFFVSPCLILNMDSVDMNSANMNALSASPMDVNNFEERRVENFSQKPEERFVNFLRGSLCIHHGASVSRRSLFERIQYPQEYRGGGGVPVFAWSLLVAECIKIVVPLILVRQSETLLKSALNSSPAVGLSLVETIFDSALVSKTLQRHRNRYALMRALSLFRQYSDEGDVRSASKYYRYAFRENPLVALRLSDTAKYLMMQIKNSFS